MVTKAVPIDDSVQGGLDYVKGLVSGGRPGLWIGRGALGGFALVSGAIGPGVVTLGNGGVVVAMPLAPDAVRALLVRGNTLLGNPLPPLPEGLVIG